MEVLASQLVSVAFHGLAYGMILYIISVGLSVTMGLMGFANLAHGVFAMAGGYIMLSMMNTYGVPFPLAMLISFVAVALGSMVLERTLYARLYSAGELAQVLFTIGLILMATAVARLIYGTLQQPVNLPDYMRGQIQLFGRRADRASRGNRFQQLHPPRTQHDIALVLQPHIKFWLHRIHL